jgi:hypothetical protein
MREANESRSCRATVAYVVCASLNFDDYNATTCTADAVGQIIVATFAYDFTSGQGTNKLEILGLGTERSSPFLKNSGRCKYARLDSLGCQAQRPGKSLAQGGNDRNVLSVDHSLSIWTGKGKEAMTICPATRSYK